MNTLLKFKGLNRKLTQPILQAIKDYYSQRAIQQFQLFERKAKFSVFLMSIKELILFQIQMNDDLLSELSSQNQFYQLYQLFFRQSRSTQYNQIGGIVNQDYFAYLLFTINVLLVIFTWVNMLWKPKKYGGLHQFYSFILSIYEYLIYIPSILLSLEHSQSFMVYINSALTFIIGLLISTLDYSLEYDNEDLLSKMDNNWNAVQFSVDIIILVSYVYSDKYIHSTIVFCLNCLKLFQSLKNYIYLNSWICRYHFILQILKLTSSIFIFFLAVGAIGFDSLFLGCLICIPVSVKIGVYVFQQLQDFLILQLIQDPSLHHTNNSQGGLFQLLMRNEKKNLDLACRILYAYNVNNEQWNSINETKNLLFIFEMSLASEYQQSIKTQKATKLLIQQQQVKTTNKFSQKYIERKLTYQMMIVYLFSSFFIQNLLI